VRWGASESEEPLNAWYETRRRVIGHLIERRRKSAQPDASAELARRAAPLAGRERPRAYCWSSAEWDELNEEWRLVIDDELWLLGFADPDTDSIHLAPEVCDPLQRFFGGDYAPT
jgi:hypothetical protein